MEVKTSDVIIPFNSQYLPKHVPLKLQSGGIQSGGIRCPETPQFTLLRSHAGSYHMRGIKFTWCVPYWYLWSSNYLINAKRKLGKSYKKEQKHFIWWYFCFDIVNYFCSWMRGTFKACVCLMGEGFILLTRGYGFMGGCTPPFWHVKNWYFY